MIRWLVLLLIAVVVRVAHITKQVAADGSVDMEPWKEFSSECGSSAGKWVKDIMDICNADKTPLADLMLLLAGLGKGRPGNTCNPFLAQLIWHTARHCSCVSIVFCHCVADVAVCGVGGGVVVGRC